MAQFDAEQTGDAAITAAVADPDSDPILNNDSEITSPEPNRRLSIKDRIASFKSASGGNFDENPASFRKPSMSSSTSEKNKMVSGPEPATTVASPIPTSSMPISTMEAKKVEHNEKDAQMATATTKTDYNSQDDAAAADPPKALTLKERLALYAAGAQKTDNDGPKRRTDLQAEIDEQYEKERLLNGDAPAAQRRMSVRDRVRGGVIFDDLGKPIEKFSLADLEELKNMSLKDRIASYRDSGAGGIDHDPKRAAAVKAAIVDMTCEEVLDNIFEAFFADVFGDCVTECIPPPPEPEPVIEKGLTLAEKKALYAEMLARKEGELGQNFTDLEAEIKAQMEKEKQRALAMGLPWDDDWTPQSIKDRISAGLQGSAITKKSVDQENDAELGQARRMSIQDRIKSYKSGGAGSIADTDTVRRTVNTHLSSAAATAAIVEEVQVEAVEAVAAPVVEAQQTAATAPERAVPVRRESSIKSSDMEIGGDKSKCVNCNESPRNVIFIPCGHTCVCVDCNQKLVDEGNKECPLCKKMVKMRRSAL